MPPRKKFSEGEIQMIISAICFFRAEKEQCGDKRYPVYANVAKCLNIGLGTVKLYASNYEEDISENTPPTKKTRVSDGSGRRKIEVDQFTITVIRRYMYDFYANKVFPTIDVLKQKLEENVPDFPTMSRTTLWKILKSIGFRFRKLNRKPVLMESASVAASRHAYLRKIRKLRAEGYKIFYSDETWCGQNHTKHYGWQEQVIKGLNSDVTTFDQYRSVLQEVNGWRGGFKTPSGAGKRVIILHIGSEDGFLKGAELCFVGKKGTSDYHNEMNAKHYEEWFKHVLNIIPRKSAIVIDQAPYHTMTDPETRNPNMKWLKNDIIEWMKKNNTGLPPDVYDFESLTKQVLINHAKPFFKEPEKILDQLVRQVRPDVQIIWLPVAHCELNPIELIWAFVKNNIAKINRSNAAEKGSGINVTKDLCTETLQTVSPELWKNCIKHTTKVEKDYWEKDHLIDEIPDIGPIVINLEGSDSESESEDVHVEDGISDYED